MTACEFSGLDSNACAQLNNFKVSGKIFEVLGPETWSKIS